MQAGFQMESRSSRPRCSPSRSRVAHPTCGRRPHRVLARIVESFIYLKKIALLSTALIIGCQSGAGYLDGAGFEVHDAIFERAMLFEGTTQITKILVSDAVDLCDRIASGQTLAGHSELAIKRFESGSVQVALRTYDGDCQVMETELASQGWVEDQSDDPWQRRLRRRLPDRGTQCFRTAGGRLLRASRGCAHRM